VKETVGHYQAIVLDMAEERAIEVEQVHLICHFRPPNDDGLFWLGRQEPERPDIFNFVR
jgi:hypothetical protein